MDKSNSRLEILKQYHSDDPADDFTEYALALEFEKTGNRKDALFHLEQIINRNADYLAAYYQCGRFLEAENAIGKAALCYQEGMKIARKQGNTKTLNELRSAFEALE